MREEEFEENLKEGNIKIIKENITKIPLPEKESLMTHNLESFITQLVKLRKIKQHFTSAPVATRKAKDFIDQFYLYKDSSGSTRVYVEIDAAWLKIFDSYDYDELTDEGDCSVHKHDDKYLYKENTDAFTPDADYEPATKKYVDDNVPLKVIKEAGEDFTAGQPAYVSTGGLDAVKEEENTSSDTTADVYGTRILLESFTTPMYNGALTKVNLYLRKVGAPAGNAQVDIYLADGNDEPTGASLGTKTMLANDLGLAYALIAFEFASAINVNANTVYIITITAVDNDGAPNRVEWEFDNGGNPYADGKMRLSTNSGDTWLHYDNNDFRFDAYIKLRAGVVYKTDANFNDERINNFIGFVDANVTAGNTVTVNRIIDDNQSGLTEGSHYYLSDTAGAISSSVGTYEKKIGIAVSATSIVIVETGEASRAGHITISPLAYDSIGQGTWALQLFATMHWGGRIFNSSHNNGDNLVYKVDLPAGTYTLMAVVTTANSAGIVDFKIDEVTVAEFDCYSGSDVNSVRMIETEIVVASGGLKDLTMLLDGKNGSSSDYYAFINYICLWRTA